jgi:hypothetical protein
LPRHLYNEAERAQGQQRVLGPLVGKMFLLVLVVGVVKLYLELKPAIRAARSDESQGLLRAAS